MKKYFKFLGLALLASCLVFSACGPEDENGDGTEQNNNNNNNNNNGNEGTAGSVAINLNGVANYTAPQDSLVAYTSQSNAAIVASQRSARWTSETGYSMYFPFAQIFVPAVVGQYDTASSSIRYSTGGFYSIYQQDPTTYAQFEDIPDWILRGNVSSNVTAFNSTSLTLSATVNGLMYNQYQGFMDYSDAVNAGTATQDDATLLQFMANAPEANMSATITSVKLRDMNSKAVVKGTPRM